MPILQGNLFRAIAGLPSLGAISALPYGDLMTAAMTLGAFLVLAFFIHFLMNFYLATFAKRTGTELDDAIVAALKKPMYVLALFTGTYVSLLQINALAAYADFLGRLYKASIILLIAYAASRITAALIGWQLKKRTGAESEVARHFLPLAGRAATVFIYVIAVIGLLDQMNVKVTALVASVGVASLAVALALQDTLANFFAGIYIMADRPVRTGDFIRLENGEDGYVEEIGWRSTKVRTLPNNVIVIPNSKLAQSVITNYYLPSQETSFFVKCGVAYGSDLEKVERVTVKTAKDVQQAVNGAARDFEPFIRFNEFGDSNINFSVVLRVGEPVAKYVVLHEFIKRLAKAYEKEGIEISWPARKVYLKR
ncbi:mechanosensitive ion channel family protein [Candidatus Woesearchaeota archaeon]|nr:mechanosensitive ion channel family protein [Candidatus Woesearchaeota archaeon]